jgi:hypothetical protein
LRKLSRRAVGVAASSPKFPDRRAAIPRLT